MRSLRTILVILDMVRDMENHAPGALHLNYVNPMAMITWALNQSSPTVQTVGLCHSVQHTARELAEDLLGKFNIPLDEYPGRCEIHEKAWPYIERELKVPGSQNAAARQRCNATSWTRTSRSCRARSPERRR